ncbi:hypothetical protein GDO78_016025 [Eleutherodactylus coqui]|uniref:Colipase N-terminal domain-containing protein n=1 Tax=Eleutherodactylus coqui TaxID=57060 RepID=A0A8J6ECY8_ELECQ|nr:hypothetical protein GDO78_016025 [Eleutherodactylus coqui]
MLVSLLSSFEVAQPELILDLNIGEFCLNSVQCISRCCQRESGLRVARCAPEAAESKECSPSVSIGKQQLDWFLLYSYWQLS